MVIKYLLTVNYSGKGILIKINRLGYKFVLLPFKPNGKPQNIKGFLDKFAKTGKDSAQFCNAMLALNIPMLGTDPAMERCYRDEYQQMLGKLRGKFNV